MRTVHSPEESGVRKPDGFFVSLGNFDGFHLGHQAVIAELLTAGQAASGAAVAVTFEPHPGEVVGTGGSPGLLTPGAEKSDLLAETGLAELLIVGFTHEMSGLDAREFLSWIGVGRGSHMVLGYDFHMGRGRAGDLERLSLLGREIGFGLDVVPPVLWSGSAVSSTRIRECVAAAKMRDVAGMLGRPYGLRGTVVRGDGVGRSIGSPTANLELPARKLLPGDGVYLISAASMEGWPGLLYVGSRPSLGGGERRAEVHLLDHEGDLYGRSLEIDVLDFMREDRAFATPSDLGKQIKEDVALARRLAGGGRPN
ncbi:MAG: riboflavin biosynthesis protein RibF [Candidatus Eisenbacteria bacterium]